MSARRIFNIRVFKLVLALGILFGLIGLVYVAHQNADVQLRKFSKEQEANKEESTDAVVVDNYELKQVANDNTLQWCLTARKGVMEPHTKDVNLQEVNVKYYKEGKVSLTLVAPVGKANEISRIINLSAKGDRKVQVGGDEKQAKLETVELELTKNNQFKASGGVNIIWPGVAKVTGNRAEGSMANANIEKLVIRGNTHATIDI